MTHPNTIDVERKLLRYYGLVTLLFEIACCSVVGFVGSVSLVLFASFYRGYMTTKSRLTAVCEI